MLILHDRCEACQVEQQRAGNVIRQIADDAQLFTGRHRQSAKVELQCITRMNYELVRVKRLLQSRYQIAIEFDDLQSVQLLQ